MRAARFGTNMPSFSSGQCTDWQASPSMQDLWGRMIPKRLFFCFNDSLVSPSFKRFVVRGSLLLSVLKTDPWMAQLYITKLCVEGLQHRLHSLFGLASSPKIPTRVARLEPSILPRPCSPELTNEGHLRPSLCHPPCKQRESRQRLTCSARCNTGANSH